MEKLKKLSLYIILPITGFILVHLIFSYINWEFNPSKWSDLSRGLAGILGAAALVFGVMGSSYIIKEL